MKTFTAALIDIKSRRPQCDPFFLFKRLSYGAQFGHSEMPIDRRHEDAAFRLLLREQRAELKKFDEGALLGCVLQDPSVLTHSPAPLHFMLMNHCIRYGEAAFFDIAERVFRLCPDGVARQFLLRSVERLVDFLVDHESKSLNFALDDRIAFERIHCTPSEQTALSWLNAQGLSDTPTAISL